MEEGWVFWLSFLMSWIVLGTLSAFCYLCYQMSNELGDTFREMAALGFDPELLRVPSAAEAHRVAAYFLVLFVLATVWGAVMAAFPFRGRKLYLRKLWVQFLVQSTGGLTCVVFITLGGLAAGPARRWWQFFRQRGEPDGSAALVPLLVAVLCIVAALISLVKIVYEMLLSAVLAGPTGFPTREGSSQSVLRPAAADDPPSSSGAGRSGSIDLGAMPPPRNRNNSIPTTSYR